MHSTGHINGVKIVILAIKIEHCMTNHALIHSNDFIHSTSINVPIFFVKLLFVKRKQFDNTYLLFLLFKIKIT